MAKIILPKTTSAIREAAVPVAGEIFYDSEKKLFYGGDGETVGGVPFRLARTSDQYVYGIDTEFNDDTVVNVTRVVLNLEHDNPDDANRYTHVSDFSQMPAHNFHRCLLVRDAGTGKLVFSKYLNASNSLYDRSGTRVNLDGTDGDVMVEVPATYVRLDLYLDGSSHLHEVYLVSNQPFEGAVAHRRCFDGPGGATMFTQYFGAFRSVACDSSGAIISQSAAETPVAYASGYRARSVATAAWALVDGVYEPTATISARAAGNWTRAQFRTAHGAHASNMTNCSCFFYQWMALMMAIDGGTWDTQAGIGVGYTNRSAFAYQDLRATGRTAVFGNGTGSIIADEAEGGVDADLATGWKTGNPTPEHCVQMSWRGFEDPFGSQWQFEDGITMYQTAETTDDSGYWCTNDTSRYATYYNGDHSPLHGAAGSTFPDVGYTGAEDVWVSHAWPQANNYVKGVSQKDLYCNATTSSSAIAVKSYNDYFYAYTSTGSRVVIRGGYSPNGAYAGSFYVYVAGGLSHTGASYGARPAAFLE